MKSSEFFNFMNKLKFQQLQLEKCEASFITYVKNNFNFDIETDFQKITQSRNQDLYEIQSETQKIYIDMKEIHAMLKNKNKNKKKIDIPIIRDSITRLQKNIQSLISNIDASMNNLRKAEINLFDDLDVLQNNLNEDYKKIEHKSCPSKYINCTDDMCPEVKEFINYLNKTGGYDGGWTPEDHALFIKFYNKNKNMDKLINILRIKFPDKTKNEIELHYEWYKKYLHLRNKQKKAIIEWKKSKTENKINTEKEELTINKKTKTKNKNSNKKKEKLLQWKAKKEEAKHELENTQTNKKDNIEKLNQERNALKEEVRIWRETKEAKEQMKKAESERIAKQQKQISSYIANRMIKEFQILDNAYINNKRALLPANNSNGLENNESIKKSGPRDPKRLLKPTKQWVARIKPDESIEKTNFDCNYIQNVPKLAIPKWRKILT